MGRIAEESIQQVIATANIVDVIGSYFPLKRMGGGYKACCPFHAEKTPSFTVSPSRNTYHCFGCGKGGSVIGFVRDYESITFVEAVRKLAAKFGVKLIEEAGGGESEERTALRVRLLALHRDIAQWFHLLLLRHELAAPARDYLRKRGLNINVAKSWLIGYAPADAGMYREWMQEHRYTEEQLVLGGIYSPRDENDPKRGGYVRFKHRVMFPIRNDHGDVIAFSGRILDADSSPAKYMNSPATPIFSKSETFFGLDKSKRAIHKAGAAIICEGQIDMIMCYEQGIENIVAPLGTAFTHEHARLLKRHTEQVVLCLDGDSAGAKAALSQYTELAREGLFVRVAALPKGDDPDSLIRRDGVDALRALLDGARDFTDWQIEQRLPSLDQDKLSDRMKLLSDVTAGIAKLRDRMAQDAAINRAAARLSAPTDELRRMVAGHARAILKAQQQVDERDTMRAAREGSSAVEESPPFQIDNAAVRQLLKMALTSPEAHEWLRQQQAMLPWSLYAGGELLESALHSGIDPARPETVAAWLSSLSGEAEQAITGVMHDNSPGGGAEAAERTAIGLELQMLKTRIDVLTAQQRQPGVGPDTAVAISMEIMSMQSRCLELQKRVRDVQVA